MGKQYVNDKYFVPWGGGAISMNQRDEVVAGLTADLYALQQKYDVLRMALERIADPLDYLVRSAKKPGYDVDIGVCVDLANSPTFLSQIAREALNTELA